MFTCVCIWGGCVRFPNVAELLAEMRQEARARSAAATVNTVGTGVSTVATLDTVTLGKPPSPRPTHTTRASSGPVSTGGGASLASGSPVSLGLGLSDMKHSTSSTQPLVTRDSSSHSQSHTNSTRDRDAYDVMGKNSDRLSSGLTDTVRATQGISSSGSYTPFPAPNTLDTVPSTPVHSTLNTTPLEPQSTRLKLNFPPKSSQITKTTPGTFSHKTPVKGSGSVPGGIGIHRTPAQWALLNQQTAREHEEFLKKTGKTFN